MIKFNLSCLIIFGIIFFCRYNSECTELETGTFILMENNIEIGKLYRKGGIQIETYKNDNTYEIVNYTNVGDCNFYLKSNMIKTDIDTLTWKLAYKKLSINEYSFIATPLNYNQVEYSYEGKLKKISNKIGDTLIKRVFSKFNISTD